MQIRHSLSIITLTGILVINASSYSFSQSSKTDRNKQLQDGNSHDYTIIKGDTLWDISEEFLKDPFLWPNIWEKNNYIRNPDLIFRGNKLSMPYDIFSKPESDKADAPVPADQTSPPEQTLIPASEEPSSVSTPLMTSQPKRSPVPAPPPVVKPAISSDTIEAGGYIINNIESFGVLRGSEESRTIYAEGDSVNITLAKGFADKVSVGEKFTIFRTSGPVIHPATKKKEGFLFIAIGVIKINRVQDNDASGEISKAYNYTSTGDQIQPYIQADPVHEIRKPAADIQGDIIEAREGLVLNAQYSIVYLDKGAAGGITPGSMISAIKERNEIIGELQVVSVQDTTSTALVIRSSEPFGVGTKVTTIIRK